MKTKWFDPNKSFLSLKIVWVTVATFILISTISSLVIIVNSDLNLDLSFSGFNFFISVFKFPLAIAALIIPIVALLAANHRSEQTKEQIRVTSNQNVFSNYYKHIEEFSKYLIERVDTKIDLRFAHSNIYPNASSGDYSINDKLISLLAEFNNIHIDLLACKPNENTEQLNEGIRIKYYQIMGEIYDFLYRDQDSYVEHITYNFKGNYSKTYLFEAKSLVKHSIKVIETIEPFCKFSIDYISPIRVGNISSLDMEKVFVYQHAKSSSSGVQIRLNKVEQTFEEANIIFIEQLLHANSPKKQKGKTAKPWATY